MTGNEKVESLMSKIPISERGARRFIQLWEAMQEVDREEKEQDRVEHARAMSQPKR